MKVIVICCDTLRWDAVGCYGAPWVETPALDVLARSATRLDRAYCASFPTIPMRTDAFVGCVGWPRFGWKKLHDDEVTFVERLREAGYYTAFVHDTSNMEAAGFGARFDEDVFLQPPQGWEANLEKVEVPVPREHLRQGGGGFVRDRARTAHFQHEEDWFVARTMKAASAWLEDNYRRPDFLLWVDTFEIHEDWSAPDFYTECYSPAYEGLDYSYPNYGYTDIYAPEHIQRLRARYAAEVTLTDRWLGFLLRTCELMGLMEEALIMVVSDHGMYLGEHRRMGKHTVDPADPWPIYDEVGRIPWLVRVPGGRGPRRCGALAQPADLAVTVLDFCGLGVPEAMDGRSLLPLLARQRRENHRHVFTSCHSGTGEGRIEYLTSLITVTDRRWTLVTGPREGCGELYDRREDPLQEHNVIEGNRVVAERLRASLAEFMRSHGADEEYVREYTQV